MTDNVFAAEPPRIQSGGAAIEQGGAAVARAADDYENSTFVLFSQDPPQGGDAIGKSFDAQALPVISQLRDAVKALGGALRDAADMTKQTGKNFTKAQEDALTEITSTSDTVGPEKASRF